MASISTTAQPGPTAQSGAKLSDRAAVTNGFPSGQSPAITGTVTFRLYGPDDPNCAGTPVYTDADKPVSSGLVSSGEYTTASAGTYRWVATYEATTLTSQPVTAATSCGDASETTAVAKATPTLSTTATSATVGTAISDSASLTGGASPSGTVTFKAYTNCSGSPVFTSDPITVASGSANSGDFKPKQAGTYYWTAEYSGDDNNALVPTTCGLDPNETSTVTDTSPPAITLTTPVGGTPTSDNSPTFAGIGGLAWGDDATATVGIWSGSSVGAGAPDYTASAGVDQTSGAYSTSGPYTKTSDSSSNSTLPDGTYAARADQSDASLNIGHSSATPTFTIDTQDPSTGDDVPTSFVNHDVTVTLTRSDGSGSGVDKTYYTTGANPADPTTASSVYDPNSKPVLQNGEKIKYFSTDKAGNAEAVQTSAAAQVDKQDPSSSASAPRDDQLEADPRGLLGIGRGCWAGQRRALRHRRPETARTEDRDGLCAVSRRPLRLHGRCGRRRLCLLHRRPRRRGRRSRTGERRRDHETSDHRSRRRRRCRSRAPSRDSDWSRGRVATRRTPVPTLAGPASQAARARPRTADSSTPTR